MRDVFFNRKYLDISGSIMHYRNDAFSTNGRPTIRPILPGYEGWETYMGRGDKMSAQDIQKLKAYYQCP